MIQAFLLIGAFLCMALECQEKPFVIIVNPSGSTEEVFIKNTLHSIFGRYSNFRVIYCHEENILRPIIEEYVQQNSLQGKLSFSANFMTAIAECQSHENIIIRDDDDWFPDENFLKRHEKCLNGSLTSIFCSDSNLDLIEMRKLL